MTQESKLKNKVAVVTGGSKGIGKALVTALVEQGAKVVIGDILVNEGEELAKALNSKQSDNIAVFVRTDVTSWDDNKKLFATAEKEFGGVDIACLNAGISEHPETLFGPLEGESMTLKINLDGVIKGNRVAILHLAKRGGGVIVNTASLAGFVGTSVIPHYTASKHGVVGWTRSMQPMKDVANVRVNAVCPYWVETDILNGIKVPGTGFIDVSPKVPMETVMDAYMTAILDESQHCQTIVALPDGVQVQPAFNLWESCVTEEMIQSKMVDYKEEVEALKSGLKEARMRANI
ncbi:hypothetical protein K450DRAFT_260358 [Umbelopsis ramanniana AG]|uniref:Uncharacterized protein n=1 Tax=Umbelopsis ramanniana AG TaxID=1314678 RepID=A0AAD5E4X7_UMBRA|nr:uncharacterized protein K450DRAFT_260358 [Umbelopsis ramanniana AG]KAI8575695.1 hypothetical protein K450DRAFT_260358 [Umbelopsis ramanniana AG]